MRPSKKNLSDPSERDAVVVFSGGQDSTTCLLWALENYRKVYAISFMYEQKHQIELEYAKKICKAYNVHHCLVNSEILKSVSQANALTDPNLIKTSEVNSKGLPATFVPNRNQLFLTLAHSYCQKVGATDLVTGVCETDYSGYPDCRQGFIDQFEFTSNLGSQAEIAVNAPLMYFNKAETFWLAFLLNGLDTVINLSHTCYKGDHTTLHEWGYGCGECPACQLRKKGYEEYQKLNLQKVSSLSIPAPKTFCFK